MARLVKCMACKREDLSMISGTHVKMLGTVPYTVQAVREGFWGSHGTRYSVIVELQADKRFCLKRSRQYSCS